jgi:mRNA interferase RelE/StbE
MNKLPVEAAVALYEHLTGPVAQNPHRLGKPLEVPYDGVWTTRRGEYRALYVIDDATSAITVVAVAHRRDVYRHP